MTDQRLENMVSILLRTGVTLAGSVVLFGGILYLLRHGGEAVDYHVFHGEPDAYKSISNIVKGVFDFQARSIIQLGLVLLILTPIARVALSVVGFALERDRVYVVITLIVLGVLIYSLVSGTVEG